MTRRLPPSQRDRQSLDAAVRQVSRGLTSLSGPGFLGGRLALPQPIPGGLDSYSEAGEDDGDGESTVDLPQWEADDRHVVTALDVARGFSRMSLTYEPEVESLLLVWEGVPQPPTEYIVDYESRRVTVPLPVWAAAGDLMWVHYTYLDSFIEPTVQVAAFTAGYDNPITLPAETREGDLLVILVMAPTDVAENNGYTLIEQTSDVTGGGAWNYRLGILTRAADTDDPPTLELTVHTANTLWVACAVRGVSQVTGVRTDTQEGGTVAETPPAADGDVNNVRIWATCDSYQPSNPDPIITPSQGTIVAEENNNVMINMVAVTNAGSGAVAATNPRDVGWTLATLTFGE